ncbi:hypothetical protein KBC59_00130 [Patescibacteria group bacterium]|nr:hypothetical protein [Patescibacteria group bacterium]
MSELYFIFDESGIHLGELSSQRGTLGSFILTPDGDHVLGGVIAEWQTQGISFLQDKTFQQKDGVERVTTKKSVHPRDAEFVEAVRAWCHDRQYHMFVATPQSLQAWQQLLRLPLSPVERFSMLYAFSALPESETDGWMSALQDAVRVSASN